jgi:hypothetical protein
MQQPLSAEVGTNFANRRRSLDVIHSRPKATEFVCLFVFSLHERWLSRMKGSLAVRSLPDNSGRCRNCSKPASIVNMIIIFYLYLLPWVLWDVIFRSHDFSSPLITVIRNHIIYMSKIVETLPWDIYVFIANCNWAYARWQCYINNGQYVNSNT